MGQVRFDIKFTIDSEAPLEDSNATVIPSGWKTV